ncbi:MAG TPA: septum formation initiator family protein [Acidimicrobiia bacterium]|nr:septum formation initiator family protein [Acidimicrobiia bacterium]
MNRWGRARLALIALAVVAILFVFVFPTRTYLAQRRQVTNAQRDVEVLRQQNDELQREAEQLQSPAAVERMAREQFHMVLPGEQVFEVMPAAGSTTTSIP